MRRALVTGASGFVGRALCRLLGARGVEVTAVSRRPGVGPWNHAVALDLSRDAVSGELFEGIDAVFHLAGFAHADASGGAEVHQRLSVEGTARLLAACAGNVHLVFASSVKAMGEATPRDCLDEDAPPAPENAYGRSRLEAERLILAAASRLHTSVIRLPLVYGPGAKGNLKRMMAAVDAGRLPLFPAWENRRSLVHVVDACEALIAAALVPTARGRVYLVTDGHQYSTRQIQQHMYRASGREPPAWHIPAWALWALAMTGNVARGLGMSRVPIDGAAYARLKGHACFDCSRARSELGFTPRHDLASALPAMFDALREEDG